MPMPIIQILILASAIVAFVIGFQAFTRGIQIRGKSKERWTGPGAKIVGVLCILYGCAVIVGVAALFIYIALDK